MQVHAFILTEKGLKVNHFKSISCPCSEAIAGFHSQSAAIKAVPEAPMTETSGTYCLDSIFFSVASVDAQSGACVSCNRVDKGQPAGCCREHQHQPRPGRQRKVEPCQRAFQQCPNGYDAGKGWRQADQRSGNGGEYIVRHRGLVNLRLNRNIGAYQRQGRRRAEKYAE